MNVVTHRVRKACGNDAEIPAASNGSGGSVVCASRAQQPRFRNLIYVRDLLHELVRRDIKLRYKGAILGMLGSLLNPLLQLLVFYSLFGRLLGVHVPHYLSFLFTGIIVWNWFQPSLLLATGAIVENRQLIKQPKFPAAILPVVTVMSQLVHFLAALPMLFVCVLLDVGSLRGAITILPLIIALQFVLTLSVAYLTATFHVTFRDTQYILGVLLQLVFFLTPVFYSLAAIPESVRWLLSLNPMLHLLDAYRVILIEGRFPTSSSLSMIAVSAAGLLLISYSLFVRASYRFVDEL